MRKLIAGLAVVFLVTGCSSAAKHRADVQDDSGDRVTVGKVQRQVKVGMSSADVIQVLGSPNIVSTDDQRREVWVYDKVSTVSVYSSSSGGISALIFGGGGSSVGGVGGEYSGGAGAASKSQRTLTIVIKFDKNSKVRDFAYHTSKF